MKKLLASIITSFVLIFVLLVPQASAKMLTSKEGEVIIPKGEIVNDDLFIGAQSAVVDGVVNGDVFVGAQTVKIGGTINGNLHIGAQTISLNGNVKGSVYVGAQSVNITSSNITGSVIAGSQDLNIDNQSVVGGSIITGAASANINTQIKRNLLVGAGVLTIGDNTKIGKDLYYATGTEAGQTNISEKAIVAGEIHKTETTTPQVNVEKAQKDTTKFFAGAKVASTMVSFIGAVIIGLLAMKLFGSFISGATTTVTKSFWKSLGIGFVIVIATIPGIIVLLLTIVGIPVLGVSLALLGLYGYLAKIIVGNALGNALSTKFNWKIGKSWAFVFGLLAVYLVKIIPVVGAIAGVFIAWAGLGAILIHIFSKKE